MTDETTPPASADNDAVTSGDPLAPTHQKAETSSLSPGSENASSHYGSTPVPPGAFQQPLPTGQQPQYVLADWWKRALAFLVDSTILGILWVVIMAVFGLVFSIGFFASSNVGTVSLIIGLIFGWLVFTLCSALYAPIIMKMTNGQTVGKMLTGCRVIRSSGEPIGFWWAVLREVAIKGVAIGLFGNGITGGFPLVTLVDGLWPLWDEQSRALHDMVADTRVIQA